MIVKNITNTVQKLWIRDIVRGTRSVQIEVLPKSTRELGNNYIPDESMMPEFRKVFMIVGSTKEPKIEEPKIEEPKIEEPKIEETPAEEKVEEKTEEVPALEDKFICDICGQEFASERGLNSHKSRAHSE